MVIEWDLPSSMLALSLLGENQIGYISYMV